MRYTILHFPRHAKTSRQPLLASLATVLLCGIATGCDRPLKVAVDMTATEKLPLKGNMNIHGTLTRTIIHGESQYDKGTRIQVSNTWLKRKQKAKPPGYRIDGYYDPVTNSSGFVLPSGAIDIFYLGVASSASTKKVIVPAEYFLPDR
jgi:hypothetical protein